jgi:hypothetical protein
MLFRKSSTLILTSTGLTAAVAMAQTTTSSFTATQTSSFPPAGWASTETAQINETNLATDSSSGTAASCTGTISFLNASGTVIGSATSYTVAGGVTASVTPPFARAASTAVRTEIRGVVMLTSVSRVPLFAIYTARNIRHYFGSNSRVPVNLRCRREQWRNPPRALGRSSLNPMYCPFVS